MPDFSKGNWPKVAIGGLVLLNVVLLAMLVLRDPSPTVAAVPAEPRSSTPMSTGTPSSRSSVPSPRATATRSETATPSETGTPSESVTPSETATPKQVGRSTRVLAVNSETLAWRGVFGPCPTTPDLEVSRDGGKTWQPTSAGLRSVTRLRSFGGSSVFAVGGSDDCTTGYVATGGPNDAWRPKDEMLGETWYRMPEAPSRVHAPGGRLSRPCGDELADFAGLGDENAAAVCADGTVRTTVNSGRTWRDLENGDDGLALGADDRVYALATGKAGCNGVAVTLLDADAAKVDQERERCAPIPAVDGEIAVAVRGEVVWLWSGEEVAISTDGALTWDRAS